MPVVAYATTVTDMSPTPDTREPIAAEVRAAMARRRITQGELAKRIGMSRAALSPRLAGHQAFDTDQLLKICAVLEVELVSLFPDEVSA